MKINASKDYYTVLGVAVSATPAEIKTRYRKLALLHHPDKNFGSITSEERFKILNEAYSLLTDQEKRAEYDTARRHSHLMSYVFGNGRYDGVSRARKSAPNTPWVAKEKPMSSRQARAEWSRRTAAHFGKTDRRAEEPQQATRSTQPQPQTATSAPASEPKQTNQKPTPKKTTLPRTTSPLNRKAKAAPLHPRPIRRRNSDDEKLGSLCLPFPQFDKPTRPLEPPQSQQAASIKRPDGFEKMTVEDLLGCSKWTFEKRMARENLAKDNKARVDIRNIRTSTYAGIKKPQARLEASPYLSSIRSASKWG